jgi:phospholipid/cholesterol/gamma-HCH transport system substrate-binding protein
MPRTRSLAWAELKIGLLAIAAMVIAGTLIFLLSGEGGYFWQRYPLKTVLDNVAGLGEGAPVRIAGVEVGSITGVQFVGERVEVTFEISKAQRPRVTTTSTATVGSVSLLGEGALDLTPSTKGTPIPDWGYVRPGKPAGSIADVTTQASEGIEKLTALLTDISNGRGTIGQLVTNEALYRDLNGLIVSAEEIAKNLSQGRGTLGRLVNDPKAARALEASLENLQDVTARIRSGEGSIGKLLNDDALATSLTSATANIDTLTAKLNRGEGTAGKLVTDQELYNRLNSMADRLDKVIASLQQGEGTAGQLLHDKQLYENMNSAVVEMRKLLTAIQADPKKYLNVRVSLF